ncbi:N-formylglutamate amidohydrolase [Flavobacterium silvaticum]|uniref:N-formylglutamate amidohydrolase n=1 Tax=Flavobacterium silvaticum TaxID=1852020 RepID=A0A972FMW6_9FLAO|nr:N-formylglutamate amidohydrolase [Flavobacterium silvaticum]NMH28165.1 N-formylglutamate amidohydrolase [Flavobacterium silvaticum]
MELFNVIKPSGNRVPIVISSPHSGTFFPEDIKRRIKPDLAAKPDDTDWFIDTLYDFAPALGITMITANYSRWVIDLNRDPKQAPLYSDGRVITGLVPTTDFNGLPLYDYGVPDDAEIEERVSRYFVPYHSKIDELLNELHSEFGKVLLWDAHSIRQFVPGIRSEKFPDLILGDNDLNSASSAIIATAFETLNKGGYKLEHNNPFKGGYITRSFGNPGGNFHALQLEMAKINYMDDSETAYNKERADKMRTLLQSTFENLILALT